jgi:hypothetical protein
VLLNSPTKKIESSKNATVQIASPVLPVQPVMVKKPEVTVKANKAALPAGDAKASRSAPQGNAERTPEGITHGSEPSLQLEMIDLPTTLIATEPISLLNAAGKEVSMPANTRINVTKRTGHGTLTMEINGALFVGNESRILGKVKPNERAGSMRDQVGGQGRP